MWPKQPVSAYHCGITAALLAATVAACSCHVESDPAKIVKRYVDHATPLFRAVVDRIDYTAIPDAEPGVVNHRFHECYLRHTAVLRVQDSILGPYRAGDEVTFTCTNNSCGDCSRGCPRAGGEAYYETLGGVCSPRVTRDVLYHLTNHTGRSLADLEGRCGPEHINTSHPSYECLCGDPTVCQAPRCARLDNGYCVPACAMAEDASTCGERAPYCEWSDGDGCVPARCRQPSGRNATSCEALLHCARRFQSSCTPLPCAQHFDAKRCARSVVGSNPVPAACEDFGTDKQLCAEHTPRCTWDEARSTCTPTLCSTLESSSCRDVPHCHRNAFLNSSSCTAAPCFGHDMSGASRFGGDVGPGCPTTAGCTIQLNGDVPRRPLCVPAPCASLSPAWCAENAPRCVVRNGECFAACTDPVRQESAEACHEPTARDLAQNATSSACHWSSGSGTCSASPCPSLGQAQCGADHADRCSWMWKRKRCVNLTCDQHTSDRGDCPAGRCMRSEVTGNRCVVSPCHARVTAEQCAAGYPSSWNDPGCEWLADPDDEDSDGVRCKLLQPKSCHKYADAESLRFCPAPWCTLTAVVSDGLRSLHCAPADCASAATARSCEVRTVGRCAWRAHPRHHHDADGEASSVQTCADRCASHRDATGCQAENPHCMWTCDDRCEPAPCYGLSNKDECGRAASRCEWTSGRYYTTAFASSRAREEQEDAPQPPGYCRPFPCHELPSAAGWCGQHPDHGQRCKNAMQSEGAGFGGYRGCVDIACSNITSEGACRRAAPRCWFDDAALVCTVPRCEGRNKHECQRASDISVSCNWFGSRCSPNSRKPETASRVLCGPRRGQQDPARQAAEAEWQCRLNLGRRQPPPTPAAALPPVMAQEFGTWWIHEALSSIPRTPPPPGFIFTVCVLLFIWFGRRPRHVPFAGEGRRLGR